MAPSANSMPSAMPTPQFIQYPIAWHAEVCALPRCPVNMRTHCLRPASLARRHFVMVVPVFDLGQNTSRLRGRYLPYRIGGYALNGISLKHRSRKSACMPTRGAGSGRCLGSNPVEPKAGLALPVSGAEDGEPADSTQYLNTPLPDRLAGKG